MPLVTGEPELGDGEAGDFANCEKGRPPDEIYEDDRMVTSSRRLSSDSTSKSAKVIDKDSEERWSLALLKGKRKLSYQEIYPRFLQSKDEETEDEETNKNGKSKRILRLQRAWVVQSVWASIENVFKISSSVLVNELQCKHIADHFMVIANVLEKLGLGKDFVFGQAWDGGSGVQTNLAFDEMHFNHVAKTFNINFKYSEGRGFENFYLKTQIQDVSSMFEDYIHKLLALDAFSEDFLPKKPKIGEDFRDFRLWGINTEENVKARCCDPKQRSLDEFLCLLLGVLKQGEDLVLFHSGLEGANNEFQFRRTGLYGEKFVQIHDLLYELLKIYACLEHCKGTEFARSYLLQFDSCGAKSFNYYLNSNCLDKTTDLDIEDEFLNIERATRISELLERPNCAVKSLSIRSCYGVKVNNEVRKCRLLVIASLRKCVNLTYVSVRGSNGKEVHELCNSLSGNEVLETLHIWIDGPLADNHAMELFTMLKEKHSLMYFTLECKGISSEGAVHLGAMLAENSSLKKMDLTYRELDEIDLERMLMSLRAIRKPYISISLNQNGFLTLFLELSRGIVEMIAQILSMNKTLTHFSIHSLDWNPDAVCAIFDSLKKNKTLQVLDLELCKELHDAHVKQAFLDLLFNYNFSLSTIKMHGKNWDIETFIKCILFESKHPNRIGNLWSNIGGTSDSTIVHNAHDLKQVIGTPHLEKGKGFSNEVCRSSMKAFDIQKLEVEAKDERTRIFLSYSNEMRDFAMHLCLELKSSNYNVVDQDSTNFVEVVDHCQLAIVVLSDMYVNSKPFMSELCTIVKSKKTNNPTLKVYALFYNLTLKDLQNTVVSTSAFGGEGMSLDNASEREALNFLFEEKNEVLEKASHLVQNLREGGVDVGNFCEQFSELQRSSWPSSSLEFEENTIICEEGYLHAILEEIFHYVPTMKECNNDNDQMRGYQGKLEMESKLSLRQMKPLLESLWMKDFLLQRKLNIAQYLQEMYIQYSLFEEMCPLNLSGEQKHDYSKGQIVAALFPSTFLYHFKAQMLRGPHVGNFLHMLKTNADLVAEKMLKECNKNGVQMWTFFDFVDYGAPLDPRRTIAICQNFSAKTLDGSKQLVVVQDDLSGVYYYQCVETSNLENLVVDETIGVIGVQVASTKIHVDNIHEDGSSYSGVLEDFSYNFDFDKNNQCAAKAFGDLAGARFLSKDSGIKCSPLLIIALASAISKKGLTLSWSNGKGHVEFYPKLAQKMKVEVESCACQIQYTKNINQLGLEIEWGTGTNSCAPHNQTCQRGTNEIVNQQVIGSNVDQNVGASNSRDDGIANIDCVTYMQNDIALYTATAQNKRKFSGAIKVAGTGVDFGYEKHDSKTKQVLGDVFQDILKHRYASKREFHRIPNLDVEYPDLENRLLRCQLHEVHDHNYLVVYNVSKARHISIYKAIEQNGVVPKFELTWISDIPIDKGEKQIKHIFESGLKGRELIVKRDGSNFTQVGDLSKPLEKIVPGYQESLLKFKSRFPSNAITTSMIPISEPNLVGILKSKNEWVHIIGPQAKYEASYKYWWKATSMEAIVYSRTMYTSGTLLKTNIELPFDGIGHIGHCNVDEGPKELQHLCGSIVSRGKFSRPPGSLLNNKVLWGGLDIEPGNLSCS